MKLISTSVLSFVLAVLLLHVFNYYLFIYLLTYLLIYTMHLYATYWLVLRESQYYAFLGILSYNMRC